jgi:peptidoglycan/LPS O-acetylase OafA/YrhL
VSGTERRLDPATPAYVTGYRPWLDGVRAIAVLLVAVQHTMGQMPVDLGFVGVGLFFALSGYLITSLLLDERALRGTVSLSRFYLRRAARLVPALVLVVIVCNTLFVAAGDYAPLRGSLAALTYTANYAEVLRGDFVRGFGPTWSLAVEEHFYLLWPLGLLWVTRRHGLRASLAATLGVCVAALLWRATLAGLHARHSLLEIGSFERADSLLYGCAAAIAVRLGWRPRRSMVWAGVAAVACMPVAFNHDTYTVAVIAPAALAIAGAVVVAGLDYAPASALRRVLSLRAIVAIGVFSYGIYLWHGPLMRVAADFGFAGRSWRAAIVVVSMLVAALSHRLVEAPIRAWARRRGGAGGREPADTDPGPTIRASTAAAAAAD